ncbi:MAG: hypothetical protein U5K84_11240 [Alkalibacterium sp.]|nr:hypothetical protein [Alkalibacterium sp.]
METTLPVNADVTSDHNEQTLTLKEKYNQKASKLLTVVNAGIIIAAYPVVYLFSYLELIPTESFWQFLNSQQLSLPFCCLL